MKHGFNLGQEEFNVLLRLLSNDRESAGYEYEQLRRGLIRYFRSKGCSDPSGLADETFNRVAARAHNFDPSRNIRIQNYFFGFASNLVKEDRRKRGHEVPLSGGEQLKAAETSGDDERISCLQKCLNELEQADRTLMVDYYSYDGRQRMASRNAIAEKLNCTAQALYTRVSRIRSRLGQCISHCDQNGM